MCFIAKEFDMIRKEYRSDEKYLRPDEIAPTLLCIRRVDMPFMLLLSKLNRFKRSLQRMYLETYN